MDKKSVNLQYRYAYIDLVTGECLGCATFSYEIIHDAYISVPHGDNTYVGLYYNQQDGLWYTNADFSELAEGFN